MVLERFSQPACSIHWLRTLRLFQVLQPILTSQIFDYLRGVQPEHCVRPLDVGNFRHCRDLGDAPQRLLAVIRVAKAIDASHKRDQLFTVVLHGLEDRDEVARGSEQAAVLLGGCHTDCGAHKRASVETELALRVSLRLVSSEGSTKQHKSF